MRKFQRLYLKFAIIHFVIMSRTYSCNRLRRIYHSRRRRGCLVPYDDDGNQTLITTKTGLWRVTYNGENRPILWVRDSDNTALVMSYDHMGRRRKKNEQQFFYDGYLQVADNNGNAYAWNCTEAVATCPLAWNRDDSSDYYAHDGNKNVSEVFSSGRKIVARYDYAPFGEVAMQSDPSAVANPWRFSSKYVDDVSGTVYYNHRHYNLDDGCWSNRDPIEEKGGLNLYAFCANAPSANFDALGCAWEIERNGDIFASAKATSTSDSFQQLAKMIKLDVSDYMSWAHTGDESPVRCKQYRIPNLVVYDMGRRKIWDYFPSSIISVWNNQNELNAEKDRSAGYMVQIRMDVTSAQIEASLSTDGLYRYTFTGHGDGEAGVNSYPDPFDAVAPILRYTKYGINTLTLQACGSAAIDVYGSNKLKGLVRRNNWECNVATVGYFIGYEGSVNLLNELFQWTIVRGTNN